MAKLPSKTKIFAIVLVVLSFALASTIFGIDSHIHEKTKGKLSIAFILNNAKLSYNGISISFYVLKVLYIILIIGLIFTTIAAWQLSILLSTIGILFVYVPKEAILLKFYSCFNYLENSFIFARCILTFFFCLTIGLLSLLYLFMIKKSQKYVHKFTDMIKYPAYVISILSLLAIVGLNMAILILLKPEIPYDTDPYKIQMGLFNQKEIQSIELGNFIKDYSFDKRLVGNLSDILFSENKILKTRRCTTNNCENVYNRTWNYYVSCRGNDEIFADDCIGFEYLKIQVHYTDNERYPTYNCAKIIFDYSKNICSVGCPNLFNSYKIYLIQQYKNIVEPAWSGLCNCDLQPSYALTQDNEIDICDVSFGINNKISAIALILTFLLSKFLI